MKRIDMEQWPRRGHYQLLCPHVGPLLHPQLSGGCDCSANLLQGRGAVLLSRSGIWCDQGHGGGGGLPLQGPAGEDHLSRAAGAQLYPSGAGGELFRIITLDAGNDLADFCRRAGAQAAAQTDFITQGPWDEDALVYFTCLPWFPLTSLTNEKDLKPWDSVPRAAWGRWEEQEDKTMLNLSLELNHRLLDGVHVGRFYQRLCQWMEEL